MVAPAMVATLPTKVFGVFDSDNVGAQLAPKVLDRLRLRPCPCNCVDGLLVKGLGRLGCSSLGKSRARGSRPPHSAWLGTPKPRSRRRAIVPRSRGLLTAGEDSARAAP